MPLGTSGTASLGGGTSTPPPTDSGVCAISPSDLVGYTGNLINRVAELEREVAALKAGNVEANQLSDLSQQVGWVTEVEYMGIPGWTQTEYGTLIPPAGWSLVGSGLTMSDGNQYQGVYMDENGVLQFGFLAGGAGVTGELPDYWNAGGAASEAAEMDYAITQWKNAGANTYNASRGITITTAASNASDGIAKVTVSQAGLYQASAYLNYGQPSPITAYGSFHLIPGTGVTDDDDQSVGGFYSTSAASIAIQTVAVSAKFECAAGDFIRCINTPDPGSDSGTVQAIGLHVVRLTDL